MYIGYPSLILLLLVITGISLLAYLLWKRQINRLTIQSVLHNSLLDNLRVGVIAVDLDNRILFVNRKVLQLLRFPDDHDQFLLLNKDLDQVFINLPEISKHSFQIVTDPIEIIVGNAQFLNLAIKPLVNPLNVVCGKIFEFEDISTRKMADEQAVLQRYALEAAASGIMITDESGRIQWVNQSFSEITGFSKEFAIGKLPSIQKSGMQNESFYKNIWDTLKSGRSWRGEIINKRRDGSLYTEEQTIAPIKKPDGSIAYYISVKQDVSERKQLEKLRDDLIQTIVHDLRNPLTSIMMSLDLIRKSDFDKQILDDNQLNFLEVAQSNTRRMANLVNTILDINRLETERIPARLSTVSLPKLVTDAIKFQVTLAKEKNILIENLVDDDFPTVQVDIAMIGRVFQNLIDNAIKFTPEQGTITIQARWIEGQRFCEVSILDSGPGLPEEMRSKIFQKFSSGNNPGHGTGLGLAYCRLAIEAHGGEIWADLERSSGTQLIFTLPIADLSDLTANQ